MVNLTYAKFFMVKPDGSGAWEWILFPHRYDSMHTALRFHAEDIGAKGFDSGSASHMIRGVVVYGSPTAFDRETR